MRLKIAFFVVPFALLPMSAFAQAPANPLSAGQKLLFTMIKTNLVRAAEKMPEENYAYKPVPEVRSFGQLIGHVADSHFAICAMASSEKNTPQGIEKSKTSKAELVKALNESIAYCDKVYDGMTDAKAAEMLSFMRTQAPRITVLSFNTAHDNEHYGNIVTYMRAKGLVPPSSEPRQ
jgi:uncharacterized damage-inducible protein DinB